MAHSDVRIDCIKAGPVTIQGSLVRDCRVQKSRVDKELVNRGSQVQSSIVDEVGSTTQEPADHL